MVWVNALLRTCMTVPCFVRPGGWQEKGLPCKGLWAPAPISSSGSAMFRDVGLLLRAVQDTEVAAGEAERTCWCLFRLSVLSAREGGKHFHRESYGRFSTDSKQTDSASLGWNDFLPMDTFTDPGQGYLQVCMCLFLIGEPGRRMDF